MPGTQPRDAPDPASKDIKARFARNATTLVRAGDLNVVFMKMKRIHILLTVLVLAICAIPLRAKLRRPVVAVIQVMRGKKTVDDRVEQFGNVVRQRLAPDFDRIGVAYPPTEITLVGLKQENLLEVWVSDPPKLLKSYPILGASGGLGPKLQEGDMQVPEGLYRIESLNPNSLYHLALRVNYPNQFDKMNADYCRIRAKV